MTNRSQSLLRLSRALATVVAVGLLVALVAVAVGRSDTTPIVAGATLVAAMIVIASDLLVSQLGEATEFAALRLMASMLVRGGGAVAAMALAVFAFECQPRVVAFVALPIYLGLLGGEVWEALSRLRETTDTAAVAR